MTEKERPAWIQTAAEAAVVFLGGNNAVGPVRWTAAVESVAKIIERQFEAVHSDLIARHFGVAISGAETLAFVAGLVRENNRLRRGMEKALEVLNNAR